MFFEINKNSESQKKIVSEENRDTITISINKFDELDINTENIKFFLINLEDFEEDVIKWMESFITHNEDIYIIIEILTDKKLEKFQNY